MVSNENTLRTHLCDEYCPECRRSRNVRFKPAGLLQPLLIPERVWQHITMNFKLFSLN
jgi:hypothetical protein